MASETMSDDVLDEVLEKLAAAPAVQTVVHNILIAPISEATKSRLLEPLFPKNSSQSGLQDGRKW